jgi:hypothetical protein
LRPFFAGVEGRSIWKKGCFGGSVMVRGGGLNIRASMLCDIGDALFIGDSVPGEGSVMEEESRVEMVVVGEESEDSDADVDVLSRCWWNTENGEFI